MNKKSFIEDKKALNSIDYDCQKIVTKKDIFMVEGPLKRTLVTGEQHPNLQDVR